jgi:hypothetical protein
LALLSGQLKHRLSDDLRYRKMRDATREMAGSEQA